MLFLLLCFLGTAAAQDEAPMSSVDYIDITAGQEAPFSGKLFTDEELAKILAEHKIEIDTISASYDFKIKKQELDLELKYDLLDSRYNAEIIMYQSMISVRDDQLKKSARKDIWQKWATYGGFLLGATTSVAIFYSVNTN